jgi:hypothetical protein
VHLGSAHSRASACSAKRPNSCGVSAQPRKQGAGCAGEVVGRLRLARLVRVDGAGGAPEAAVDGGRGTVAMAGSSVVVGA